jgi:hypothetical protein
LQGRHLLANLAVLMRRQSRTDVSDRRRLTGGVLEEFGAWPDGTIRHGHTSGLADATPSCRNLRKKREKNATPRDSLQALAVKLNSARARGR